MALIDELDLVNTACAVFGDDPLQSLDDDEIGGQPAALIYNSIVDYNLALYNWSFGRQLFALSRNDLVPKLAGYRYAYDLPAERLEFPIYITDDVTDPNRRFDKYAPTGDFVQSNAEALAAMCRFRPAPRLWSATFRMATTTALAAALALARAHDKSLSQQLHTQAYGTPQDQGRGGEMGVAIKADSFGTPWPAQAQGQDPLTVAWRS